MASRTFSITAVLAVLIVLPASSARAQGRQSIAIRVSETSGIRRTEYPVRAEVQLPQRSATDINRFQLLQADAPVPAQFTVMSKWPDGSAQNVDVDFNATLNPGESRAYQVVYSEGVSGGPGVPRGLTVTEAAPLIQINNTKFGMSGAPLIASAQYARAEFINQTPQAVNTFAIVDNAGVRHELATARDLKLETVKNGPLVGMLRFTGRMPIDGTDGVAFTLTIDMPNSKSWVKTTASVTDPARRVRDLEVATPLAMGAFPWTWDFGTENGTYGSFRSANDGVTFTQVVGPVPSWKVETAAGAELRPYESSMPSGTATHLAAGWGHIVGTTTAVAFGIDDFGRNPGAYIVTLNGQGQATYRFSPSGTGTAHRFGVYQHFVSTPVPIGAATTAMSMLHPPVVTVETGAGR